MRDISRWTSRISVVLLGGLLVTGLLGELPAQAASYSGTVRVANNSYLNVRSGPGTSYGVVGQLRSATTVAISCQVNGELIGGSMRTTRIWDRLANGLYVTDAYLSFGSGRPAIPGCTMAGSAKVTTMLNRRANASTLLAPLGTVPASARLAVTCQLLGESIVGSLRTTNAWDRLADGSFVADAYVGFANGRPAVPWCVLPGPTPPAAGAAFVSWIAPYARTSMKTYRVPASVSIAQAILESGWGRSGLTVAGNAYFGMKCFGTPGPIATGCRPFSTSECLPACGPAVASFRLYPTITASFNDHGANLSTLDRYRTAMTFSGSPDRFAQELQHAGYATSPTYATNLTKLMRTYNLYQYDHNLV